MSPAWVPRLLREFDAADERARAVASALTPEQLNWKPAGTEWSVGQCLDHLCVANDVYIAAMEAALDGRPHGTAAEITPGWFGRWFIDNYIEPSARTRRGRAPKKIAPAPAVAPGIDTRLLTGNARARDLIRRAADYDVNRVRFKNPFVRGIRFTVGTGLEILVRHQRRHLLQAERVRAKLRPTT
jgi:hypothetical protein